ncbi:MAG: HPP family protein [Candidatus Omnitrophica bacterium]|nr:HPP family protein [Candidatus Omnitrophota bacterium]
MHIIDEKFKHNKWQYIGQCFLAAVSIFIVLLFLDARSNSAIIASLGASFFIVFTMPETQASSPRFLIGGYCVGIITGCICYYLSIMPVFAQLPFIQAFSYEIFGACAVGVAIFVMVITDTEHPPAAGVALGFVLNGYNLRTIAVVLIGIISLAVIKTGLKPVLKNLL